MINIRLNIREIQNNVQPGVYFLNFLAYIILTSFLLCIFITPSKLNLFASGIVSDNFVHNPRKGNRMLGGRQNHSTPIIREHGTKAADLIGREVAI